MNPRYLDIESAFSPGAFFDLSVFLATVYIAACIIIAILHFTGKLSPKKSAELKSRTISWAILIAAIGLPIVFGQAPAILGITLLSLFCFNEYARAVGLFREKTMTALGFVGIIVVNFAALDVWYNFFNALSILTVSVIAGSAILKDQPKGYTERVGLAIFGFMFFGFGLAHISFMANDQNFRALLLFLFLLTELNDVFAYVSGHLFGRRKLLPYTSPGKTKGGALGAAVLTTILAAAIGPLVFVGTPMDSIALLAPFGLLVSVSGQLGDLMLSSIKRDIGVKDLGTIIPGHGGFLDRFDSLVLSAPIAFHYLNFFGGINFEQLNRLITR